MDIEYPTKYCVVVATLVASFLALTAGSVVGFHNDEIISGTFNSTFLLNWIPCFSIIHCVASCDAVVKVTVTSLGECELALFHQQNSSCSLYTAVTNTSNENGEQTYVYGKKLPDVCDIGWTYALGSCYITVNENVTWFAAEERCNVIGSNLTSVTDITEHELILQLRLDDALHYWIGGRRYDNGTAFVWYWTDGEPWEFENFASGQPSDTDSEKCMAVNSVTTVGILKRNLWNDRQCHLLFPYICEKNAYS